MNRKAPIEHATEYKYMQKSGNDGYDYASLPDKNNIFKWKKINPDITNAIEIFKFWHTEDEYNKKIKYNYKELLKKINLLKKELHKYNIYFYYLDFMGQWSGLDRHFIDYSWDDAMLKLEQDNAKDKSIVFTDDIYVLQALLNGKLYFQHNVLKEDINNLKIIFYDIFKIKLNFSNKKSIIVNI